MFMATDLHTALGMVYKAYKCPTHQEIYSDWPTQTATLIIATCMKTCPYCGNDFNTAAVLRKHLKIVKYASRNLVISQET
jgi:lipoate synthase